MMKVKVFRALVKESDSSELEQSVNAWLAKNPDVCVEQMTQSESISAYAVNCTLTILYRKKE